MCAVESNKASYSWLRGSHRTPHQSQWLETTLSELDEKTKAMLALIEEDGDTFVQRAEMYYKKRPELVKMVEEFYKSNRSLAERHDQYMRYDSAPRPTHHGFSSSTDSDEQDQNDCNVVTNKFNLKIEHQDKVVDVHKDGEFAILSDLEREKMWSNLRSQVSMLMEDNLKQQSELIRRNEEKRKAIKELGFHLDRLMDENKSLQKCTKVVRKQSQSQISKLKRLILGKLLWAS